MRITRPLLMLMHLLHAGKPCTAVHTRLLYQDITNSNGNGEIHFRGVRLHVESPETSVSAVQGSNATLPCHYRYEPELSVPRRTRVKWFWQPVVGEGTEKDVIVALGSRLRSYGDFKGRVRIRRSVQGDASLVINPLLIADKGRYRCEIIDGLEDDSVTVELKFQGRLLPSAESWKEGLDWCNAGWLADGTVQYAVSVPREACGGMDLAPGVRSYGTQHKTRARFDVFCFTSSIRGEVYFLQHPLKLNFTEAVDACVQDGAQIAKVGQLYAAWKLVGLDQCDAGWLSDGSIRYPIVQPRLNCGPPEPGVRTFGYLPKYLKYGVYCHKPKW
uniref:Hyaluronan and proteoglycan link protein 3 n=1 Tax=Electrophorus electricus TaxID=8005 RepID=A0A4W4GY36_ELEEL